MTLATVAGAGAWRDVRNDRADTSPAAPLNRSTGDVDALSDEALVDAIVRRGSQPHFRTLVARHKQRVFHIALSVLGPGQQAAAEDAAQETFIQLHRRLSGFRGDSRFSTWLYRMAFNQAIDERRRQSRHRGLPLEAAPEAFEPSQGAQQVGQVQDAQWLQPHLEGLPRAQRVMLHLHYWLGYRVREIAEVLGCPENTVKVYLSRARQKLAAVMEEERHER